MTQKRTSRRFDRNSSLNWTIPLSLVTGVVAAGTILLHLLGEIRHRNYLSFWGIDANLFPKATDWILIHGYQGAIDRSNWSVATILSNPGTYVFVVTFLVWYVHFLWSTSTWKPAEPRWLELRPKLRLAVGLLLLSLLLAFMIPFIILCVTALMKMPADLGESAGRSAAKFDAADHAKGCSRSQMTCVDLKQGAEVVATGYLLDVSTSHIAIFDTQQQRARVLPIEKIEVVSNRVFKVTKEGAGAPLNQQAGQSPKPELKPFIH